MRAPNSMMLHVLRQHAAHTYRQPELQVHPLFSVLPHLLRPEVSSLVSLSSFSTAAGSSTQVVEPRFKVIDRLISVEPAEFALPARPSPQKIKTCTRSASSVQRTDLFNAHPRSLQYDRPTDEPRPEVATSRFRQALLTISGFYSKESQLLRGRWGSAMLG